MAECDRKHGTDSYCPHLLTDSYMLTVVLANHQIRTPPVPLVVYPPYRQLAVHQQVRDSMRQSKESRCLAESGSIFWQLTVCSSLSSAEVQDTIARLRGASQHKFPSTPRQPDVSTIMGRTRETGSLAQTPRAATRSIVHSSLVSPVTPAIRKPSCSL